jgi:hypothetical protein
VADEALVDVGPVGEDALLAIEITNRRRGGDDVLESALGFLRGGHGGILHSKHLLPP